MATMALRCSGSEADRLRTGGRDARVPPPVTRQLRRVRFGVEHVQLDDRLLTSSQPWRKMFNPTALHRERSESSRVLPGALGAARDVWERRGTEDSTTSDQQHTDMQNLCAVNQDLSPYVNSSVDRIKQYCDQLGVTDRYTGYRHNLSRSFLSERKIGHAWMEKPAPLGWDLSEEPRPPLTQRERWTRTCHSAPVQYRSCTPTGTPETIKPFNMMSKAKNEERLTKSIQERSGINTVFPGSTEYMDRYNKAPPVLKPSPFVVNPDLNLDTGGRTILQQQTFPKSTEYRTRYGWPDGTTIVKLPWLKAE